MAESAPPLVQPSLPKAAPVKDQKEPFPDLEISHRSYKSYLKRCCIICFEDASRKPKYKTRDCKHIWCQECLRDGYRAVIESSAIMREGPRCCRSAVPFKDVESLLEPAQVHGYRAKEVEAATRDRIYCHGPECRKFIAPALYQNSALAKCSYCLKTTCVQCKAAEHGDTVCQEDESETLALGLAKTEAWKRCPFCSHLVEKKEGCPYVRCRCETKFCYRCGAEMNELGCKCVLGELDESELYSYKFHALGRQRDIDKELRARRQKEQKARREKEQELKVSSTKKQGLKAPGPDKQELQAPGVENKGSKPPGMKEQGLKAPGIQKPEPSRTRPTLWRRVKQLF